MVARGDLGVEMPVERVPGLQKQITRKARAAAAPAELVARLKGTMRACRGVSDHQAAVELELEPQLWSLQQPAFKERLAALQQAIQKKRKP